mgnify:CR=1 FL=1
MASKKQQQVTLDTIITALNALSARITVLEKNSKPSPAKKNPSMKGSSHKPQAVTTDKAINGFTVGKAKKGVEFKEFYDAQWKRWINFRKEVKFKNDDSRSLANRKVSLAIKQEYRKTNPKADK